MINGPAVLRFTAYLIFVKNESGCLFKSLGKRESRIFAFLSKGRKLFYSFSKIRSFFFSEQRESIIQLLFIVVVESPKRSLV